MRRGAHPGGLVDVLVGDWNAKQRRVPSGHHCSLGGARGSQRVPLGHQEEGIELRVLCLDPRQQLLHQFHR